VKITCTNTTIRERIHAVSSGIEPLNQNDGPADVPLPRGEVLDMDHSELGGGGEEAAEELVGDGYRQHAAAVGEAEPHEEGEGVARVDLQSVLLVVRGGGEDALSSEVCRRECGPRGHCSRAGVFIYRVLYSIKNG